MERNDRILGILIGLAGALAGSILYLTLFTNYTLADGIFIVKQTGQLSKIITLGAIMNLLVFFILLRVGKDGIAKGVLIAMFGVAALTLVLYYL